jgi:signal transduction histidine kinase
MAEINFSLENRELFVVIRDNGTGLPEGDLNRFGNGIRNMKSRMEKINGKFEILNDCGTRITLSVTVRVL